MAAINSSYAVAVHPAPHPRDDRGPRCVAMNLACEVEPNIYGWTRSRTVDFKPTEASSSNFSTSNQVCLYPSDSIQSIPHSKHSHQTSLLPFIQRVACFSRIEVSKKSSLRLLERYVAASTQTRHSKLYSREIF